MVDRCTREDGARRRPRRSESVLAWVKALAPYAAVVAAVVIKVLGD